MFSWLSQKWVWWVGLPLVLFLVYGLGIGLLDAVDDGFFRISVLPKLMFDQTFYLQWLARDVWHGTHLLPWLLRPFVYGVRGAISVFSWSEIYVVSTILAFCFSIWTSASLFQRLFVCEVGKARGYAIAAFLLVQAILGLRPGAPSWYIPFFLISLMLLWRGYERLSARRYIVALVHFLGALFVASVYPWYAAIILGIVGLLWLHFWITVRRWYVSLGMGLVASALAFLVREDLALWASHSSTVRFGVIAGVGFGHMTTLSNTILVQFIWLVFFLLTRRKVYTEVAQNRLNFFCFLWLAQAVLWWQSVVTGFLVIPDHFIYTVWIASVLSAGYVWLCPQDFTGVPILYRRIAAFIAGLFVVYIFAKFLMGIYSLPVFSSLIIHTGIWMLLAAAFISLDKPRVSIGIVVLVILLHVVFGIRSVHALAQQNFSEMHELVSVERWLESRPLQEKMRPWCTDFRAGDFLFANTGVVFHPSLSDRLVATSLAEMQARLVDVARLFVVRDSTEEYLWEDQILADLDFSCRAFRPFRKLYDLLPLSPERKAFFTGCDEVWVSTVQRLVLERMNEVRRASLERAPVSCYGLIIRRRLESLWRVPSSFTLLYEDEFVRVFGGE